MGDKSKLFKMRNEAERLEQAVQNMRAQKVDTQETAEDRASEDSSDEDVSGRFYSLL